MQNEFKKTIERLITAAFFWLFFALYVHVRGVDVELHETFIGFEILAVAVPYLVRVVNNQLNG